MPAGGGAGLLQYRPDGADGGDQGAPTPPHVPRRGRNRRVPRPPWLRTPVGRGRLAPSRRTVLAAACSTGSTTIQLWTPDFAASAKSRRRTAATAGRLDGELRLMFVASRQTNHPELAEQTARACSPAGTARSRAWRVEDDQPVGHGGEPGHLRAERDEAIKGVIREGTSLEFIGARRNGLGPCRSSFPTSRHERPTRSSLIEAVAAHARRLLCAAIAARHDPDACSAGAVTPTTGADWIFVGAVLNAHGRPLADHHGPLRAVLTRKGACSSGGPPDAVILSLGAEARSCSTGTAGLGYTVRIRT